MIRQKKKGSYKEKNDQVEFASFKNRSGESLRWTNRLNAMYKSSDLSY